MTHPCEQAAKIEEVEHDVSRLSHAVFGNSEPGIRTTIAVMAEQQRVSNRRLDKIESHLSKILWLVLVSVIAAGLRLVLK